MFLSGLDFAFRYLDDILIYNHDPETHFKHLDQVFQYLLKGDLNLKESKCNIWKNIFNI